MTNYDILKEYEAHNTPVPSYEEWQQLRKFLEEFNALEVAKENQRLQMSLRMTVDDYKNVVDICEQLKELLKECRHIMNIEKDFASCHFEKHKLGELLTKIDNAIGEKK